MFREFAGSLDFADCPADNGCIDHAGLAGARATPLAVWAELGGTGMKRIALAALCCLVLAINTGCQHCCWTIFPDVAACGPGPGCGERYWGDWKACPDPCDKCANWVGHGHAGYNKWGRRDDGGGCIPECQSCGQSCNGGGGCSTCGPATSDCGCGGSHGQVYYTE